MSDSFGTFLISLVDKKEESWTRLYKVARTMVEHAFEKDLLEIAWVPEGDDSTNWFSGFFGNFKLHFEEYIHHVKSFDDLKDLIIAKAKNWLSSSFAEFAESLKHGNEKSWKLVNVTIEKRMIYWIVKHSGCNTDKARHIYQDGISLLYEKLTTEELNFENSKKLKSYLMKILENKIKENQRRKEKLDKHINIETLQGFEHQFGYSTDYADKEPVRLIREQLLKLDKTERQILIKSMFDEMKLKTIAVELGITEENCRIIKFRALKKLRHIFINQLAYNN